MVLNAVDFIYRRDVAITYELSTIIVQTVEPDPYSSTDAGALLNEFKDYWQANHTDIVRDVAHLFTGKEVDGNIIGVAWLPGVCTGDQGYGLSQSKFTDTNFAWRVRLTAHELGHNWNAPHCNQGAAPCLDTCSIMCSSVSGCVQAVDEFESCSRDSIIAYRDSLSCLEPSTDVMWTTNAVVPVGAVADDRVGTAVAVNGDLAVIGAYTDDAHGANSGAAYIFRHDPQGNAWTQEAKISPNDGRVGDRFGISVGISVTPSGEVAVIGAYLDDDLGRDSGAAYVFRHIGSSWVQETKLHADDREGSDLFGRSVAIARANGSDAVIVGSFLDDDSGIGTGSAYVFRNSGSGWVQETKLHASDPHDQDQFGFSVGLAVDPANNEHIAIVGAYKTDDNALDSGSAYIFHKTNSSWSQVAKLHAGDPSANDQFGIAASISISSAGPVAIVGSFFADGSATDSGAAYIFRAAGSTWMQEAKLVAGDPGDGDHFGNAVSISGDMALIGAYFDNGSASHTGAAYIFQKTSTGWAQQVKLADTNGVIGDQLGFSVAINGDLGLIGAWAADNSAGADAGAIYFVSQTPSADCNNNGVADSCDIANGTSQDSNANGVPDECESPPNPCPADIAPTGGNGIVNVDDLLSVINGWGPCPAPPASCPADIAPQPFGNGVVNVDDLLAVINGWGACP